ncbi:LamG domain-containing protein [Paraflavitalea soli]|nr:LamG domain-containing protein [Paraflavitalea soli]
MHTIKCFSRFLLAASIIGLASCSKDDNPAPDYNSNKTRLKQVIDSLTAVSGKSVEGSKPGQYVIGAKKALDSVLSLGNQVYTGSYTQQQVNNAVGNLLGAGETFSTKLLQEVSVANLMAFWKFNGNANDSSGHGHHGALITGLTGSSATVAKDGGVLPQAVADRFGRAGMAYDFNTGATVEVPYSAELNPQNLTISLWVKRHTTNPSNYLVSINRWNGYKFQLQGNNFPFFTFQDSNNGYHDVDANPGTVPQDVWTQVAITYTNGSMKFYVNGDLVKTVAVNGTPITVNPPVNMSIGNELPKSAYNLTDSNSPNYYYGESFLNGSLDDVRIYNTALSAAEILSIYTQEKTL